MGTINGEELWEDVELPDDGDPANQATFEEGYQHLTNRDQFLLRNTEIALVNLASSQSIAHKRLNGVCFGNGAGPYNAGMWVACGNASDASDGVLMLSCNGLSWHTYLTSDMGDPFGLGANFYGVAHGGSGAFGARKFVFCGQGRSISNNPCLWIVDDDAEENASPVIPEFGEFEVVDLVSAADDTYWDVCWTGSVWVAVGDSGLIKTSPDGETWTTRTPDESFNDAFRRVIAVSSTRILIFGDDGEIQLSTNSGATWARVFSNSLYGTLVSAHKVLHEGEITIVVGTSDTNVILRSDDLGASFDEIEVATEAPSVFPFGKKFIYGMRGLVACRIQHETDPIGVTCVSSDLGLTWEMACRSAQDFNAYVNGFGASQDRGILAGSNAAESVANLWILPLLPGDA